MYEEAALRAWLDSSQRDGTMPNVRMTAFLAGFAAAHVSGTDSEEETTVEEWTQRAKAAAYPEETK